ncbi:hemolysin family protein [Wenxinia marina]|uniref:Hemolysin n=1 Tax=Wenxinia marina DSM 24838 TaxID=1123501 RepID=A0A0D0NGU9_9RHOB|nr:hemolysin family protein [Wenxinia marina]KIQ67560.1 Hemolysin [Wenxinia marina DSM 24838]GGL68467.1 conjugation transfer protein [Wenxinia marina]
MGETTDGPLRSTAEEADGDSQSRGFFTRIIEAFSPPEGEDAPSGPGLPSTAVAPVPGILNLRRMRVEDVAIPHADIVAVPSTVEKDELVRVFRDSGLTRLPVFENTIDTPLGFVNLKDFALKHGFGNGHDFDLRGMLRPLLYVPPSMPLGVLLTKMQAERTHMALVIDEYGGTDGLVTIEDLLETVVGEIEDEHDVDEATTFVRERPGVWLALARTPLDEFESETGVALTAHDEIDEEEVDSLGGLVFMLAGHVPARGEVIRHPDGPEFEVIDADPRRIKRLRVRLRPALAPDH